MYIYIRIQYVNPIVGFGAFTSADSRSLGVISFSQISQLWAQVISMSKCHIRCHFNHHTAKWRRIETVFPIIRFYFSNFRSISVGLVNLFYPFVPKRKSSKAPEFSMPPFTPVTAALAQAHSPWQGRSPKTLSKFKKMFPLQSCCYFKQDCMAVAGIPS